MTQTRDIFAEKMIVKLVRCGQRYNALRSVLHAIVADATLGDSTVHPTLLEQAEQVLEANPHICIDGVFVKEKSCAECGASDPMAFGHWDTCSKRSEMKFWQHDETGLITNGRDQPSGRWHEIPTVFEDDLPELSNKEYDQWYGLSVVVDGVRVGPSPKEHQCSYAEGGRHCVSCGVLRESVK